MREYRLPLPVGREEVCCKCKSLRADALVVVGKREVRHLPDLGTSATCPAILVELLVVCGCSEMLSKPARLKNAESLGRVNSANGRRPPMDRNLEWLRTT